MATIQKVPQVPSVEKSGFLTSGMAVVWAIALAKLLFHVYFNNRYGYFRDEFDYLSCGDHLQWGYVDQPPLIPFLTHISRAVLGDSLRAIRLIPALASSLLVVQAAAVARELGDAATPCCSRRSASHWGRSISPMEDCLEPTSLSRTSGWAAPTSSFSPSSETTRATGLDLASWRDSAWRRSTRSPSSD